MTEYAPMPTWGPMLAFFEGSKDPPALDRDCPKCNASAGCWCAAYPVTESRGRGRLAFCCVERCNTKDGAH